jgi:4-azaleucine resistance transporter AzlC
VDSPEKLTTTKKSEFLLGLRDTFPLVVGAAPFGLIYGALAVSSGLSTVETIAMSALVFAGASQFIAVGLFASGAGGALIVLTTLIVNLRHSLYGITLSPYLHQLPQRWLAPLAFWLTDETFVVTATHFEANAKSPYKHWYMLSSSLFMYLNWQLWTAVGVVAGQAIPNPAAWGLDFAMVVTFIGILVPRLTNRPALASAAAAGFVAVVAYPLPNRLGLFLAVIVGITAGVLANRRWPADTTIPPPIVFGQAEE